MAPQVWLLTGCTSGSGLSLAHAISARGDLVIATGRSITNRLPSPSSPNITLLDLDITSPLASIRDTITTAISIHGRIDVLVNNAGISRLAALEEMSEEMLRGVFEVNLFGAVKMTQTVLPHMRSRKEGTVVFVGAGMGWVGLPFFGGYSMSKAALTSMCLFLCLWGHGVPVR
jgi:NAD(P)-dependent dehydrogenase (short-subunit alcohol dehydrogenase family)